MNHPSLSRTIRMLVAAAVSGAVLFGPLPSAQAAETVRIVEGDQNNAATWKFVPADITVPAGTTITWRHEGQQQHSVTSDTGAFDSGTMGPGATWSHRFDTPGEYPYTCTPHPYMTGRVIVT